MVVVVPCEVVRNGLRLGQCEGPTITTRHALSADGRNDRHFPRTTMVMGYHPKTPVCVHRDLRLRRHAMERGTTGNHTFGKSQMIIPKLNLQNSVS